MKWALFERIGARFARFRTRRRPPELREIAAEFTTEELAEFLEGDTHPNDARPEFRDGLREELWALVQETHAAKPSQNR
jgi:hypothetical protein